ncbi:sortase domain-bontaining protein [Streptomyces sp. NPDC059567]|uniref:sortase domain-containing protein n=1 Tax=Streptomyces sp. NPDC059567 TaxID=3346867 RepID=UPI0036769BA2
MRIRSPDGHPRRRPRGAGDAIEAGRADGSTTFFEVRETQPVDKKDFPTNKVYGKTDRPELRLITCGGPIRGGHRTDDTHQPRGAV